MRLRAREVYWKGMRFLRRRRNRRSLLRGQTLKQKNLSDYRASVATRDEIARNTPLEVFLELSNRCNINCKMCALHDVKGGGTMMSWETIGSVAPLFRAAHRLHAHGFGEPTLNRQMWPLLEMAKRERLYVDFFTNGTLLTAERAELLVELAVDEISVSFDGASKETFEWVREGASHEKVVGNIRYLAELKRRRRSEKPMIKVNFVAMKRNFAELAALVELAASFGAEEVEVKPLVTYDFLPDMHGLEKVIESAEDERVLEAAAEAAARHRISFNVYLPRALPQRSAPSLGGDAPAGDGEERSEGGGYGFCWYPFRTVYIRADGNVKPCCYYWDQDYPGSLRTHSIDQIWRGEGFRSLRRQWARGEIPPGCRHCEQFKLRPPYDDTEGILTRVRRLWR